MSFHPIHSTGYIGCIIENDLVTATLNARVKEYNNIEVQFGKQVVGLGQSSQSWRTVILQDGTQLKTKLLVGV